MKKIVFLLLLVANQIFAQSEHPDQYFDFWVGEWNASWDEGEGKLGKGTNTIKKTLDG